MPASIGGLTGRPYIADGAGIVIFGVRLVCAATKLEMLEHRMAAEAELAGDLDALVARRHAGEGDAGIHHMLLGAIEAPEKIEMPPRAAEFAVGDGFAGRPLPAS